MNSFRKRLVMLIVGLIAIAQTAVLAVVLSREKHDAQARALETLRAGGEFVQQLLHLREAQANNFDEVPFAETARDLVGAEVALVAYGPDGPSDIASTLPITDRSPASRANALSAVRTWGQSHDAPQAVRLANVSYVTLSKRTRYHGAPVDVVLLKPEREILARYDEVRSSLLCVDGVAIVLALAAGVFFGRRATRSVGELMRAARRIREGRYDIPVEVSGRGEFRGLAITFNAMQRNIAEREADITHHAYNDSLTGLPNRAAAQRHIEETSNSTARSQSALVLMDVRNVQQICASLGHQIGDALVCEVARCLQQNIAPGDFLARVAESQFLVIAHHCARERSLSLADQLAQVIGRGFHLQDVSLDLHVVCGLCWCDIENVSADELLRRVQIALQDAVETRSRVASYDAARDEELRRRLTLITDLRTAIDQNELSLCYQPKMALATHSVKSLEALVRWKHPRLGAISPGEFVPLAERTGGARRLTSWVLSAAVSQMGIWRREGLDLEVAVNLSAPDVLDPSLGDEVLQLLRTHQVDARSLVLEITESAVMRDPTAASRNMQLLRAAGVRFAIDDFGTGQSSLSQLSLLPVDELKIDRSLIARAHQAYEMERIATLSIELGHSIGLHVVAEGVEDPEVWDLLRRLGCDFAQGYLISAPLPAAAVPPFIRQANHALIAPAARSSPIHSLPELEWKLQH